MYFRAQKKQSKEVSLYEPIGTDKEGNEINLLDVIESAPVDIVEAVSYTHLKKKSCAPERTIRLRYP